MLHSSEPRLTLAGLGWEAEISQMEAEDTRGEKAPGALLLCACSCEQSCLWMVREQERDVGNSLLTVGNWLRFFWRTHH